MLFLLFVCLLPPLPSPGPHLPYWLEFLLCAVGVCSRHQPASAEEGFSIHRPGNSQHKGPAQLWDWKQKAGRRVSLRCSDICLLHFLCSYMSKCLENAALLWNREVKLLWVVGPIPLLRLTQMLDEGTVSRRPFLTWLCVVESASFYPHSVCLTAIASFFFKEERVPFLSA